MTPIILIIFALTYVGMAVGRVPGLKVDRTGIALLAVVVLLASGAIQVADLGRAIDAPTLLLLFALMIISAQFGAAGFYDWCAARIASAQRGPTVLLAMTVGIAGGLSAVLANDIVVFAMAPLLCRGLKARGVDPRPYLIALACAANAGSAATLIGNPQNILIGQTGFLDFWKFLLICAPPAIVSLLIIIVVLRLQWHSELAPPPLAARAIEAKLDMWQADKGLLAVLALVLLFSTDWPREIGALVIAAFLLMSRRLASRDIVGTVDWPLLVLFACLFTVTLSFTSTGYGDAALHWLQANDLLPNKLSVLAPLSLVGSNTIGNVPAVILLLTVWVAPPPEALYGLALLSTLAGNFLIVGSLANIIVVERAQTAGVKLSFLDHARSGVPITLLTMALATGWLWLIGLLPW